MTRRQQMNIPVNARMAGTNPQEHPKSLDEAPEPAEVQLGQPVHTLFNYINRVADALGVGPDAVSGMSASRK